MIYDCILIHVYDKMDIYIFMLLFCMYFLGMLFNGGAGADFIAMAVFILFVLLGGLVYNGINTIGKHIYWLLFLHRKQVRKKARKNR